MLKEENLEKVNQALAEVEKRTRGPKKKQVARVRQYLNNKWEGICYSKAGNRLGTGISPYSKEDEEAGGAVE